MRRKNVILAAAAVCALTMGCGCARAHKHEPDHFGIYTARLDGTDVHRLAEDPTRELNHARLSPDRKFVTFTRYSHASFNGYASEDGGYERTEIMLMNADGSDLKALVPAKAGHGNANSYFMPDGKSIIFVSTENQARQGREYEIDLASRQRTEILPKPEIPDVAGMADPHCVRDLVVFTAQVKCGDKMLNQLWLMKPDGCQARRLTNPIECLEPVGKSNPVAGDFDPKLSPDARRVACMRHVDRDRFDVIVIDLATGKETDISKPVTQRGICDAVPEWSGDGKLIAFWHVNKKNVPESGIWTMAPDGKERRRVPLPHGFFYTMPAFFPGEAASTRSEIIFSGRRQPGM